MASDRIRGNSNITLVFLDTNAIFMVFEFSIDLEEELSRILGSYIIQIPEAVINELKIISSHGKGNQRLVAKPALELIKKYPVLSHSPFNTADDALLQLASEHHAVVVTNDKELRHRLKDKKVSTIFLRGKHQLVYKE